MQQDLFSALQKMPVVQDNAQNAMELVSWCARLVKVLAIAPLAMEAVERLVRIAMEMATALTVTAQAK